MSRISLNLRPEICLKDLDDWIVELHVFDEIDSTNSWLKDHSPDRTPCLVLAQGQRAGRGRYQRSFLSAFGKGIYLSLCFDDHQPRMWELYTPLALVCALEDHYQIDAQIKWPNDVLIKGKKVAGVLVERSFDAHHQRTIVGLGVNVYAQNFPEDLSNKATYVEAHTPLELDRSLLINQVLVHLRQLMQDASALERYRRKMLPPGTTIYLKTPEQQLSAKIVDVNEQGHLLIQTEDGRIDRLIAQEIELSLET